MHLGISLLEMLEIAHTISHRNSVKLTVDEVERKAIAFGILYHIVKTGALRLLLGDGKHIFRQVDAHQTFGMQFAAEEHGKIAGACGHVKQRLHTFPAQKFHCLATPQFVDAESHCAVHKIVNRRDGVKHLAHLLRLALFFAVWHNFLRLVVHLVCV